MVLLENSPQGHRPTKETKHSFLSFRICHVAINLYNNNNHKVRGPFGSGCLPRGVWYLVGKHFWWDLRFWKKNLKFAPAAPAVRKNVYAYIVGGTHFRALRARKFKFFFQILKSEHKCFPTRYRTPLGKHPLPNGPLTLWLLLYRCIDAFL